VKGARLLNLKHPQVWF